MKSNTPELNTNEIMLQMSALLLKYDYKPQGKLLAQYSAAFNPEDLEASKDDAEHVLGMFGGWGGLVDIILADEHGPNIEDNSQFDSLRSKLFKNMKKLTVRK